MDQNNDKLRRWPYAAILASRRTIYHPEDSDSCRLIQDHRKLGSKLCMAILHGDNRQAQQLIDAGAPVNHQDQPDGWTPLIYSIYYNNPDGRELLIDRGADLFLPDFSGRNLLMFAALTGNCELVGELIRLGISPELTDSRGRTALDFANSAQCLECIELLSQLKR